MEFLVAAGLDQGDPFPPVACAATLPLGTLQHISLQSQPDAQTKRPVSGCLSILDDLTLAVPSAAARPARQLAEAAVSDVVLWLNMSKCMVSKPARELPAGIKDGWEQAARHDGLFITGRPHSVDNATLDTDAGVIGTVFPVRDQKFQADFANSMRDKIAAALEPIEQPTALAEVVQPARRSASVLLQHHVSAKVPPPTTNHAKPGSHMGHTCDSQYCAHQLFHTKLRRWWWQRFRNSDDGGRRWCFASNQCVMRTVVLKAEGGTAHARSGGHIMGNDAHLRPTNAAESDRDKSHDDTQRQVDRPG